MKTLSGYQEVTAPMARSVPFAIPPFLVALCCICADACSTTYVRVPAVCPRDPFCLDDRPDAGADARAREESFLRRHAESTVVVRGARYLPNSGERTVTGVGTLVGSKGYVLTAFHLIDGAETVTVTLRSPSAGGSAPTGRDVPAIPLILSRDEDVALLALPSSERLPPSLPLRYGPVLAGDDVRYVGAGAAILRGRVTDADVSEGVGRSFSEASIRAAGGDGAPVMNACGEVVGVALGPYGKRGALRFVAIDRAMASLTVSPADFR